MNARGAKIRFGLLVAATWFAALPDARASVAALIDAVSRNDAHAVAVLIAEGADVNAALPDGFTTLHAAARGGQVAIAELLLEAGADARAATRYQVTPLALAAESGSVELMRHLLDAGADPNETSREAQPVLFGAALNGSRAAVDLLIERGADVNARESFRGQTALMWAAAKGNVDASSALEAAGADVLARSDTGFTALLFAVRENRIDAAMTLLGLGADIEDQAPDGTTALNMAVLNAYYDLASHLLDAGADPNAIDLRGSALHTLAWLHKPGSTWDAAALSAEPETAPRPAGRITALELARKLLQYGADPNRRVYFDEQRFSVGLGTTRTLPGLMLGRHYLSDVGATAFYVAARNGDYRLMEVLVEFGADPTLATETGVTPLMAAAGLDYYEGETPGPFVGVPEAERLRAVKLALELGNDIDARTDFGEYPMIGSAEFTLLTYPRNIGDLLDLGVGDPRFNGMTAVHGAVISNQPSILRYLIEQGADVSATNDLGWTPLMIAEGIFLANAKKEFPAAVAMLRAATGSPPFSGAD